MLYPFTLTTQTQTGTYNVNSGSGRAFAFTIPAAGSVTITVVQTAMQQQDFSLRCWIASDIAGSPVSPLEPNESLWHALRTAQRHIVVYDETLDRPAGLSVAVPAGDYFVNILNLTNAKNAFAFSLT